MELAPDAHAVTEQLLIPFAPNSMDTRPAAISGINMGIVNGFTLL